jgi:hypothetical protein
MAPLPSVHPSINQTTIAVPQGGAQVMGGYTQWQFADFEQWVLTASTESKSSKSDDQSPKLILPIGSPAIQTDRADSVFT